MKFGQRNMESREEAGKVYLYDTTLRDGSQGRGIQFSLGDKLKIAEILDEFGVDYIEGGWPGSNPKDSRFFKEAATRKYRNARIVAFGSTCRVGSNPRHDKNMQALRDANTPAVAMFGKSSTLHVTKVLGTTLEENLRIIRDSIGWMKELKKEVIFDAEHFFDGFNEDPEYALSVLKAAEQAGADWLVLCDTNGGSLPQWISDVIKVVRQQTQLPLGIHAHNDSELAVANSLIAVEAGCRQVQGTINGYGERCGNANLSSIIPNLQLKLEYRCLKANKLASLTEIARRVAEIANMGVPAQAPFVGMSAFAHKGGVHVSAVEKISESYEHIDPALVGNRRDILISELSGRGNVRVRSNELGLDLNGKEKDLLQQVKNMEDEGFQFEGAEGSFELMLRRSEENYRKPFEVVDMMVVSEKRKGIFLGAEAIVKLKVNDEVLHTAAEGGGPVDALDTAMRKALLPAYPALANVHLVDYKVRILDPESAVKATTRVMIEAASDTEHWSTVGCSENIIEASAQALVDSFELYLGRQSKKKVDSLATVQD